MKWNGAWAVLILGAALFAGCPVIDGGNRVFTSADTDAGRFPGGLGAENDGEGAPALDEGGGEREVVEPDVIRRQGNLLYVLNQYRGLTIVDLDTDTLLAQVPTLGYPRDLYFSGGQAYVLVSNAVDDIVVDTAAADPAIHSRVYAVDISTPAEAFIRSSTEIAGDLVDSRLVGEVLYAVTLEYNYYTGYYDEVAFAENVSSTSVTSVDVSDPAAVAVSDSVMFSGAGNVIHVTPEFAFVAAPNWQVDETDITCLDITDPDGAIRTAGSVSVRGHVGDKFKMDAWDGALRVVSSAWQGTRQVYLTTFDLRAASLPQLAEMRVDGAEGETLFATRFDGPRAYIVTFLVVDPLFVVDVANPAAPRLLGALEVPGYSTHIEARGDRLIALGVDNTDGQKVSVSIFDVSGDAAPSLVDRVSFGEDWAWSSAYSDVKALTILDDVIIVPFSGWSGYAGGFDRLQFVSYTADSLQLRGDIDLSGSILRSFDYSGFYYGVTTEQVTRIDGSDLDNPAVVASVTIAENVVDYLPVNASLGAEIVSRYDEGQILVRTVDGAGNPLGELIYDGGVYFDAYQQDDTIVVVGVLWGNEPSYTVAVIDIAEPAEPVLAHEVSVAVYPYSYYYGYYDYGFGGPEVGIPEGETRPGVDARKDVAIGYPYYPHSGGEKGFLLGDQLVLRCYAERFDTILGDATPYEGLAVVDIAAGQWSTTIGLGYEYLVSLNVAGDTLYASTKDSLNSVLFQRPLASYYIREIDVRNATEGAAANVPGSFVQYDPASGVLLLEDHQWTAAGGVAQSLKSVRWSGGTTVERLDSLALAGYASRMLPAGGRVYFDQFDDGYQIAVAYVGADGALTAGAPVSLSRGYGQLIGADGDHVFAGLGYSAIGHYVFGEDGGALAEVVPISGYPSAVVFGNGNAYFPLGYYGLVVVPLGSPVDGK